MDLFNFDLPLKKVDKHIRLIELFAGYGSQALALKYLGVDFEHYKISEWAIKSIQAYKDIHFHDDNFNYSNGLSDEEVIEFLDGKISIDYNNPIFKDKIKRYDYRKIYNNMKATNNVGSICCIKGEDLEIVDTDKYEYVLTYSYPCQDLSLAGKRAGMEKGSGTRSSLLFEVERLLNEVEELPQILLMENVTQVHAENNIKEFNEWKNFLESKGYRNYDQDLIASDYGIPQTRNRTFMVSILGDYLYEFPKSKPLTKKLKDFLEEEVDEKYFLSEKMINYALKSGTKNYYYKPKIDNEVASPINTTPCSHRSGVDNYVTQQYLKTGVPMNIEEFLKIKENTKKGYSKAYEGDGVYINRPHQKRGCVQHEKIQTLKTQPDVGVVVKKNTENYIEWEQKGYLDINCRAYKEEKISGTLRVNGDAKVLTNDLVIRRLTELECFRLMGVKDEDFYNVKNNQSMSSLYHLAGDSIVVNVLMEIFKKILK